MMTAERLKGSILQLAMQGKLVEQRPEEGTGEELYIEIQAEKRKQYKERKIKKGQKLTGFIDEEYPFDIPETWRWSRLGEIINFRLGKTPPRADASYWGEDVPWVSIADMVDGKTIMETKECVSNNALAECFSGQLSHKGTLIMSFKLTVGKVSILGMDAVHNEAIISILPFVDTDFIMRDYLKYMLPILAVFGESKKAIMGFTLNSTSLNNIPIPLPPLAEQKRIVAKLEELVPFVEQYSAASTKLKTLNATFPDQMKKSIIQEALQGKLVPQDLNDEPASVLLEKIAEEKKRLIKEKKINSKNFEGEIFQKGDSWFEKKNGLINCIDSDVPFSLPSGWAWIRIGQFINIVGGSQPPKSVFSSTFQKGYVRLIQIRDYKSDEYKVFIPEKSAKRFCTSTDIMIGRYGPPIFQILRGLEGAYNVALMKATPIGGITQDYLYYLLKDPNLLNVLLALSSRSCGQDGINMTALRDYIVGLPPLNEQERIVKKLDEILPMFENVRFNSV